MKHCLVVLALGLLLGGMVWTARLGAQGEKGPDIKEIMGRLNKPTGIYFSMTRELKEQAPDWAEVQMNARLLGQLAGQLTRTTPPRGDRASWDRQIKAYIANAQAAETAIRKMDKAAAQAALARMGEPACTTCHKAHRP